jgi:hypothetical protein
MKYRSLALFTAILLLSWGGCETRSGPSFSTDRTQKDITYAVEFPSPADEETPADRKRKWSDRQVPFPVDKNAKQASQCITGIYDLPLQITIDVPDTLPAGIAAPTRPITQQSKTDPKKH